MALHEMRKTQRFIAVHNQNQCTMGQKFKRRRLQDDDDDSEESDSESEENSVNPERLRFKAERLLVLHWPEWRDSLPEINI